jgi:DNA-binding LacI/PurR family transcriptional regulator
MGRQATRRLLAKAAGTSVILRTELVVRASA